MKAIIFSAGLGTRLEELTKQKPKALVELNEKPLIWHAIHQLLSLEISEIIINIHHFGQQIIDYVTQENFPIPIYFSDERDALLDTGGGLLKAKTFLQGTEPIIAVNVDVISSVNLKEVLRFHQLNKPLVTLVVRDRITSRYLMFSKEMQLSGWINKQTNTEKISRNEFRESKPLAFSGIQILSPEIYKHITETGKFSIIELYLRLAKTEKLLGFIDESDYWLDLGKPGQIEEAELLLKTRK